MGHKKTHEQFLQEFNSISNEEYELLSNYVKAREKVKIKHNCVECNNHEFLMTPTNFLHGSRCPVCIETKRANKRRKTQEQFEQEIFNLVGNEYTVIGEYKSDSTKILIKHNCDACNHNIYEVKPNNFLNGKRCPKCKGGIRKTHENFLKEFNNLGGSEYILLSEYINDATKILIKHNCLDCNNNTFKMKPSKFIGGQRCPKCGHMKAGKPTKTLEIVKQDFYNLVGDEYTILSDTYKNSISKLQVKHNICNNVYTASHNNFIRGRRCPFCNTSKGEMKLENILSLYKINHIKEYSFYELTGNGGGLLRFDFAIFDKYNNLSFLCEYDGEFHYKKMYLDQDFEGQVYRDNLKNEYCKQNKLDLLRIPYWDFDNIETILTDKLKEKGLI